jgi:hypothetical protein
MAAWNLASRRGVPISRGGFLERDFHRSLGMRDQAHDVGIYFPSRTQDNLQYIAASHSVPILKTANPHWDEKRNPATDSTGGRWCSVRRFPAPESRNPSAITRRVTLAYLQGRETQP